MRAGIGNARGAKFRHDRNRGKHKDRERRDEHRKHGHLNVESLDFLAQVLRRPSNHQTSDEYREDDKDEDSVQPRANSAKNNFAEHDVYQRHHAAQWRVGIVHAVHRAAASVRGHRCKQS